VGCKIFGFAFWNLGFGDLGSGIRFRYWVLGFRYWVLGFGFWFWGSGFRV
jgi:hypothetical protein